LWRAEAQRLGFPRTCTCSWVGRVGRAPPEGRRLRVRATVGFSAPRTPSDCFTPLDSVRGHQVLDYVGPYEGVLKDRPRPGALPLGDGRLDNHGPPPTGRHRHSDWRHPPRPDGWLELAADVREGGAHLFILAGTVGRGQPPGARPALRPGVPLSHPSGPCWCSAVPGTRRPPVRRADPPRSSWGPRCGSKFRSASRPFDGAAANAVAPGPRGDPSIPSAWYSPRLRHEAELSAAFGETYRSLDLRPGSVGHRRRIGARRGRPGRRRGTPRRIGRWPSRTCCWAELSAWAWPTASRPWWCRCQYRPLRCRPPAAVR